MKVAMIDDESGRIISMTDSDDPNIVLGRKVRFDGLPVKQSRRIIIGCDHMTNEEIVEKMRAKHDNGDGTVEMEHAE